MKKKKEPKIIHRIVFPGNKKHIIEDTDDIITVKADGHSVDIDMINDKHCCHIVCLLWVEKRLDPDIFFRCGRSVMFNMDFKRRCIPFKSGYLVTLQNGDKVKVSKRYVKKFNIFREEYAKRKRKMKRKGIPLVKKNILY